ncbi:UNVERIFIED_CONTAM: hypothetical protein Cloal_3868 [Acetivibrio alkalicellulosi]
MKIKIQTVAVLSTIVAYIVSCFLLFTTPFYQSLLYGEGGFIRTLFITHLLTGLFLLAAYYLKRSVLKATCALCIIICSFAVLPHSKLLIGSDEIEKYLSVELTAFVFLSVIILVMFAIRLNKYARDWNKWFDETGDKGYIDFIIKNRIKLYSAFTALTTIICLILIAVGFAVLYRGASVLFIILIAVIGLMLLAGCVLFVLRNIRYLNSDRKE